MKIAKRVLLIIFLGISVNLLFGGGRADDADIAKLIKDGALVVDTRTAGEFSNGHIKGAVNIPYDVIDQSIGKHVKDKTACIIVYCRSGSRSSAAKKTLVTDGYSCVINGGSLSRMRKFTDKK